MKLLAHPFQFCVERRLRVLIFVHVDGRSDLFSSFQILGGFDLRGSPEVRQRGLDLLERCVTTARRIPNDA
jgi:hypothetical protein